MAETIQLRGHHLSIWALNYWKRNGRENKHKGSFITTMFNRLGMKMIMDIYGKEFLQWVYDIYPILESTPDTKVKIVDGLDFICSQCPAREKSCYGKKLKQEDNVALQDYNLELGHTYSVDEIIRRFIAFTTRTGFLSSRDRYLKG